MEFRRSGGRDERRRRVLMDDSTATDDVSADAASGAEASPAAAPAARNTPEYAQAAEAARQLRLSDLMPCRPWLVAVLTLLAALAGGGIAALAWHSPQWSWLDGGTRAIFSAEAPGSLASWFASLVMLLCAGGAIQIYLLRRHKVNDYRGRYRLWPFMAAAFLLASADAVARLHLLLGLAMAALLPQAWLPAPEVAWMLPFAAIVGGLGIRLAIEVRLSYGTLAALGLSSSCYLVSGAMFWNPGWIASAGAGQPLAASVAVLAAQLAGHVFLLLAIMVYGRYVHLAANGLLAVREPKTQSKRNRKKTAPPADKEDSSAPEASTTRRPRASKAAGAPVSPKASIAKSSPVQPVQEEKSTARSASKASPAKEAAAKPSSKDRNTAAPATLSLDELAQRDDLDDDDTAHLSKAERRRLKKLQRRSGRAA